MHTLAVVPIFINTGAAVLPAVVAAAASVAASLFKPRMWLQLLRRPKQAAVAAAAAALITGGVAWGWHGSAPGRTVGRKAVSTANRVDWVQVAETIYAQQQIRLAASGGTGQVTPPASSAGGTPAAAASVKGQAFQRVLYHGGPAPLGLTPLWNYKPESTVFFGTPAVVGKRIYVAACQSDLGAYDGMLVCLDAETGKPIWEKFDNGGDPLRPFFSSPAVTTDGKYLVIGQGLHQDRDCSLLCFETATGRQVWSVKTPLHIESSPAIFGDIAVAGAGAIEGNDGKATGDPGFVFAVRISDGKQLWKQAVNDPESSPVIDDHGVVFIGSGCNGDAVVAIRSEPDEELRAKQLDRVVWRTPVGLPMLAPVALAGNRVIAAGGNGDMVHSASSPRGLVVALDKQDGKIVWQATLGDAVLGGVTVLDGTVVCPSRDGEVVALSEADGSVLWRARVSGNAPVLTACAVTRERTYAVSNDGYLAVLATSNGKVLEKVYLNEQGRPGSGLSLSPPQVINNQVIAGSETGGLRCLQGAGGNQ